MSKKPIIVFEGIEGSGKSTHISNVSRRDTPLVAVITPVGSGKKKHIRHKSSTEI